MKPQKHPPLPPRNLDEEDIQQLLEGCKERTPPPQTPPNLERDIGNSENGMELENDGEDSEDRFELLPPPPPPPLLPPQQQRHQNQQLRQEEEEENGKMLFESQESQLHSVPRREDNVLRRRLREEQSGKKGEVLKNAALQDKVERLENELQFSTANYQSNCFSRIDHGKALHLKDFGTNSKASTLVNNLYTCRCNRACVFNPPNVDPNRCKTTSPTQLHRMVSLLEAMPSLKDNVPRLYLMSSRHLPWGDTLPGEASFEILGKCPTLELFCQDINGWHSAYMSLYGEAMTECFGQELINPSRVIVVLAPKVKTEHVPLSCSKMLVLNDHQKPEAILADALKPKLFSTLIFVVPFTDKEEDQEIWKKLLKMVPTYVDVVMVPQPQKLENCSQISMSTFVNLFKKIKRESGKLGAILPDTKVIEFNNKSLMMVGEEHGEISFWNSAYEIAKSQGILWPKFKLEKSTTTAAPEERVRSNTNAGGKVGVKRVATATSSHGAKNVSHPASKRGRRK